MKAGRADPKPDAPAASTDGRYLLIVGGLLLAIIVILAALWLRERQAAVSARADLARLRARGVGQARLQQALGRMMAASRPAGRGAGVRAIPREDLPSETVRWNGRPRTVLRLGAGAGRRIGLEPGDVIVVSPPASGPATAPARRLPE